MKKVFFITLFVVSACATKKKRFDNRQIESVAVKRYQNQIKICDDEAENKSKNPEYFTTVRISRMIYEQTECYKIIDEDYTHIIIWNISKLSNRI
ncbi:MAG: hypothetical protein LBH92_07980 [Bacteroidales bacterium]|jgi:hypothetical protein|nr:hypothetical protein [Bacteroidales bacterium]